MKQLNKLSIVLLTVAILFILYLLECKRAPEATIADDEMVIKESVWNEIKALADRPTKIDTIWRDSIVKVPVYIRDSIFVPVEVTDSTYHYSDSTVNKDIRYWQDIWTQGPILAMDKKYEPVYKIETITIEKFVPEIVDNPVPVYEKEWYLSGVVGGSPLAFSYGVDLDYVNKKKNIYGAQYRRINNQNFYYFKIGTKILPRK